MTKKQLEHIASLFLKNEQLSFDNIILNDDYYCQLDKGIKLGYNAGYLGWNYDVYFDKKIKKIILSGYRTPSTFLGKKLKNCKI